MKETLSIFSTDAPSWWGRHIVIGAFSVLFLLLGIDTLVAAYHLKNPHEFIMYFFASNLMILVSAVWIIYAGIRLYYIYRPACQAGEKDGGNDE
ncbi:MAG: hypothetical protein ABFD62_06130 [Syntrophaceae bacterium]